MPRPQHINDAAAPRTLKGMHDPTHCDNNVEDNTTEEDDGDEVRTWTRQLEKQHRWKQAQRMAVVVPSMLRMKQRCALASAITLTGNEVTSITSSAAILSVA